MSSPHPVKCPECQHRESVNVYWESGYRICYACGHAYQLLPGFSPHPNIHLREAFSKWLSSDQWSWNTYSTLTYARAAGKGRIAEKFLRRWLHFAGRNCRDVTCVSFLEAGDAHGRLHHHCLLALRHPRLKPAHLKAIHSSLWAWWSLRFGRCEVELYKPSPDNGLPQPIADYLSKYVSKSTYSDHFSYNFYGFLNGKELQSGRQSLPLFKKGS